MHSCLLFSVVLSGKRSGVRRNIMKSKLAGAAALAGAFVAGMLVATALSGGMAAAGAKTPEAWEQGQQVILQKALSPTGSDEDIAWLLKNIRAMKMQGM